MYGTKMVTEYLHLNTESFADWEPDDQEYRSGGAARKLNYRLYEVAVDMEVNLDTGDYRIIEIRDGGAKLRPVESP